MLSIEHLAHDLQQVVSWHTDNQPCQEHHITEIVQAAINMPGATDAMKGTAIWLPHRSGDLDQFRDGVMSHIGCNLDNTFSNCHSSLVFLMHQGTYQRHHTADDAETNEKHHEWWQHCVTRSIEQGSPWGDGIPRWLLPQIYSQMLNVSGAALAARQLGYHVQFITLIHVIPKMYQLFPHVLDRLYIPCFSLNIGTKPARIKMSEQRNRLWQTVTDDDVMIRQDVASDHAPHYEYDDVRMTPDDHEQYRDTYTCS